MKILIFNVYHHLIFLKIYLILSFYHLHLLNVHLMVVIIYLQLLEINMDVNIFFLITLIYSYKILYHHFHVDYYLLIYFNTFIFINLSSL